MFYLLDMFYPHMLSRPVMDINFIKLFQNEARELYNEIVDNWEHKNKLFVNAISDDRIIKIISELFETTLKPSTANVLLSSGDDGLLFTLLTTPPAYDFLTICNLIDKGQFTIYKFKVY